MKSKPANYGAPRCVIFYVLLIYPYSFNSQRYLILTQYVCSPLRRAHSRPYRTTGKITVLAHLNLYVLGREIGRRMKTKHNLEEASFLEAHEVCSPLFHVGNE